MNIPSSDIEITAKTLTNTNPPKSVFPCPATETVLGLLDSCKDCILVSEYIHGMY